MRYKADSPPYEHTCPECGRHQEVYEYSTEPEIELGKVEEIDGGIRCGVIVDLNKKFKCVACGYVRNFYDAYIETGETVTVEYGGDEHVEISSAIHSVKRKLRKERNVEEYL